MKLVLITGSCGLVGQEVTNLFIKKKYKVIGVDNDKRKFFLEKNHLLGGSKKFSQRIIITIILILILKINLY